MSNVSSPRRCPRSVVGFVWALSAAGCLDGSRSLVGEASDADRGTAVAAITMVPGAVQCVVITLTRPRTGGATDFVPLRMDFPVTAGAPSTLSLGPLPAGEVRVGGAAYDDVCDGLEPASAPTWVGDAVTVNVQPGRRANIPLTLRRNVDQRATVDFVETPTAVVAGFGMSAALYGDGEVSTWGWDFVSVGGVPRVTRLAPLLGVTTPVVEIALGVAGMCLRDRVGLVCIPGRSLPAGPGRRVIRHAMPTGEAVVQMSVGFDHACVVSNSARLYCWGSNEYGQLDGVPSAISSWPTAPTLVRLPTAPTHVAQVAAARTYTCGVMTSGQVECWGSNDFWQLGTRTPSAHHHRVPLTAVTQVVTGDNYACALLADGTARCWGSNGFGQLGNGTNTNSEAPVVVAGLHGATALAVGGGATCALLRGGSVQCWGANHEGAVGNGTGVHSNRPVPVPGLADVVEISGGDHLCARKRDGSIWCWGQNASGQLGDGTFINRFVPTAVAW